MSRSDRHLRGQDVESGEHGHAHSHDDGHEHSHGKQGGHGHSHGGGDGDSINLRGAIIHVLGDFVQSIGVAIAGALIWWKQVSLPIPSRQGLNICTLFGLSCNPCGVPSSQVTIQPRLIGL